MRIAQLAEAVTPKLYGGTEVSWLTDELVGMGHEVVLFAFGGSISNAALVAARSWHQDPLLAYSAMLARLAELASQSDVVHSYLDWVRIPLLRRLSVPFVTTLHGRIDALCLEIVKEALHWRVVQTITFAAHQGYNADEGSWCRRTGQI